MRPHHKDHLKDQHVQTANGKNAYDNNLFGSRHLEAENLMYRETECEEINEGICERIVFEVDDRIDGT